MITPEFVEPVVISGNGKYSVKYKMIPAKNIILFSIENIEPVFYNGRVRVLKIKGDYSFLPDEKELNKLHVLNVLPFNFSDERRIILVSTDYSNNVLSVGSVRVITLSHFRI